MVKLYPKELAQKIQTKTVHVHQLFKKYGFILKLPQTFAMNKHKYFANHASHFCRLDQASFIFYLRAMQSLLFSVQDSAKTRQNKFSSNIYKYILT